MKDIVRLTRTYTPDGEATLGKLELPNGWSCYTLELPWKANQRMVSCIPEGAYALGLVSSPLVTRLSGGKHLKAWELLDVPNRSHILLHAGNYLRDTRGCILVGAEHTKSDKGWMVSRSVVTYDQFVVEMAKLDKPYIEIRNSTIGWP